MKLTLAAVAAVAVCLFSLAARSRAIRAAAQAQQAYLDQERIALAAIDGHLRSALPRLAKR
jgi:hypothetical protein